MEITQKKLTELSTAFYNSATNKSSWTNSLASLAQMFDSQGALLLISNNDDNLPGEMILHNLDPMGQELWQQEYHQIDPRLQYMLGRPPSTIGYDYLHTTEAEIRKSEFYDLLGSSWGTRYYMGRMYKISPNTTVHLALHRNSRQGHVQQADIDTFQFAGLAMANALSLAHYFQTERARIMSDGSANIREEGLILLNKAGRVASVNSTAELILNANEGLNIRANYLEHAFAPDNTRLRMKLQNILGKDRTEVPGIADALAVKRRSGKRDYHLLLRPFPNKFSENLFGEPALAIFIYDPEKVAILPQQHLASLYGLSPREAEMAYQLVSNDSLKESAESMFISPNTARVHLRHIFEKTETRSQSELMRLLLTGS